MIPTLLKTIAKPFLGKGIIDSHFPFLIIIYQKIYLLFQKDEEKEVSIPLKSRLIVHTNDVGVGFPLLLKGEYEKTQTEIFLSTLKPEDTVLDIGANIGYYTVLAGKAVGQKGRIIAFEPDRENNILLDKNITLNKLTNVTVINKAVSRSTATLEFNSAPNKAESGLSQGKETGSYTVCAIALDDFLSSQNFKKINVIKIDIEGAEIGALEGGRKELSKMKDVTLFIEYNPASLKLYQKDPTELLAIISDFGFTIEHIIDHTQDKLLPYSQNALQRVLGHTTYCNLICKK